ncbi:hypothetical protein T484DRAFT_1906143 [Baffinella frigidus]|nr:hypothetical protein T484DRAFT_1906143 [Cryptophyta sp. CCMP2293]
MGKGCGKKNKHNGGLKNYCWYCGPEREFADEVTLIQHQRTKHFQCTTCFKKLTTAKALKTHLLHVHKIEITTVPNAKVGRDVFFDNFDISGMDNVEEAEAYLLHPKDHQAKMQKTGPSEYSEYSGEMDAGGYPPAAPKPPPGGTPPRTRTITTRGTTRLLSLDTPQRATRRPTAAACTSLMGRLAGRRRWDILRGKNRPSRLADA